MMQAENVLLISPRLVAVRGLETEGLTKVGAADITYLAAIGSLYRRKVLNWPLSNTLDPRVRTVALEKAVAQYGTPKIFSTDQADRPEGCRLVQHRGQSTPKRLPAWSRTAVSKSAWIVQMV